MTSKSVFTCLFLICVISSTKEQFVASYLTPHANRWNQYTGSAFHGQISALSSQLRANNEYEPSTHVFDQFETIRKKTFSAILLSFMISSISEMTLIAPAEAAIPVMKAESKVVSAYVPGLPTETASMPEPKQTAAPVAVEIKADASIAAEIKEAVVELPAPKVIVPKLTASEILKASVEPKITLLKDISFSFKLFPGYINSKDYVSFRAGLRQQPAMDLRKTCKILKPFLPSNVQEKFQETYSVMIDAVNDMDVLALKRVQGTGVPEKGATDDVMLTLLNNAITKLDELLVVVSSTEF